MNMAKTWNKAQKRKKSEDGKIVIRKAARNEEIKEAKPEIK
jgi:hypothetical protein